MNAVTPLRDDDAGPLVALELEQQVLGGLLVNNKAFDRVAAFLQPEHFGDARHAEIYASIKAMIEGGKPATPAMLSTFLNATGALAKCGGAQYLGKIITSVTSPHFVEDYARALLDLWSRRAAIQIIDEAGTRLRRADLSDPAAGQLAHAATTLDELASLGSAPQTIGVGDAAASVETAVRDIVEHGVVPQLVPTGFREIDRVVGGLEAGEMIVLAARPSMGKTALAQWMAYHAARGGYGVAFFSVEMAAEPLTRRWVSGIADVPASAMKTGKVWESRYGKRTERPVSRDELERITDAVAQIRSLPIHLDARAAPTAADIVASVRKMKREKRGADLVIIDYLGLMRSQDRWRSRYEEVTAISGEIKAAAKKLGLPILVLAQLSRANESREDKRPTLSDLRDSGAIEQDADAVWMLHREHYYLARSVPQPRTGETPEEFADREAQWRANCRHHEGKAEVAVIKSRNGAVETVRIAFEDRITRFADLDDDQAGGDE